MWSGRQAAGLGLSGTVGVEALELLLSGRDPVSGTPLGRELLDRFTSDGRMIKAVSGFDATFSAPKSLLCRTRHSTEYADVPVMPRWVRWSVAGVELRWIEVGIFRGFPGRR